MVDFSKTYFKKVGEGTEAEKTTRGYKIGCDIEKNRVYITWIGFFDKDVGSGFFNDFKAEIKKRKRNFDIISDMSRFRVANKEGEAFIKTTMQYSEKSGERYSVRVANKSKMGPSQLQRAVEESSSPDMRPEGYFDTFQEAEDFIDELIQKNLEGSATKSE